MYDGRIPSGMREFVRNLFATKLYSLPGIISNYVGNCWFGATPPISMLWVFFYNMILFSKEFFLNQFQNLNGISGSTFS